MKRVAIIQPNYIPWKGYFDIIHSVDEFILFDDAQYTKRDWRNRNQIKTPTGLQWLTIPVMTKGRFLQKICETEVMEKDWTAAHWKAIEANYGPAPYFKQYRDIFRRLYEDCQESLLHEINRKFLVAVCEILGIKTALRSSLDLSKPNDRCGNIIAMCQQVGADVYLSGPSAKEYLQDDQFRNANIRLEYMDYANYPTYHQLHGPFEHYVSVIDLLFNEGPKATKFMKSF